VLRPGENCTAVSITEFRSLKLISVIQEAYERSFRIDLFEFLSVGMKLDAWTRDFGDGGDVTAHGDSSDGPRTKFYGAWVRGPCTQAGSMNGMMTQIILYR
jgi:hypothetical protein